jgi:hypothetical protein
MTDAQTCISCGMPMRTTEEHAASDPSKNYCCYCAREDGQMKSYPEALSGMIAFLQSTQGLPEDAARSTAEQMMAKWSALEVLRGLTFRTRHAIDDQGVEGPTLSPQTRSKASSVVPVNQIWLS